MFTALARRPVGRTVRRSLNTTVALESLEDRVVLSAAAAVAPLATITDVVVNDVQVVENQLVANATVTGTALGRAFTQDVQIPIDTATTPGQGGACDVLNLTLGPVNLNVLGLNVSLDNCNGGPITVDITGNDAPGNLLGNLVCDLSGLLDNGGLGGLTTDQLNTLTTGVTDVLNGVLGGLTDGGTAGAAAAAQQAGGGAGGNTTDVLNLHLDPIHLNLLGLQVDTSAICLDVTAQQGNGNLLGNLVGSIAHLLDKNPGNAVNSLLRQVDRVLGQAADELLVGNKHA